jgi:hypothetical protein
MRIWAIGLVCLIVGTGVGTLVVRPEVLSIRKTAVSTPPDSPSTFFSELDLVELAETASGRARSKNEIATASASVSGGGLRWGERWFAACWENQATPREDIAGSLESALDKALAEADVRCANPVAGQWQLSGKLGSVFLVERRYHGNSHSGRLRAWLTMGDQDNQANLFVTVDEP